MKSINNPQEQSPDKIIKKQARIINKQEKIILEQNEIISAQNETIDILKDERDFYKQSLEKTDTIIDKMLDADDKSFKESHSIILFSKQDGDKIIKNCDSLLDLDDAIIDAYKNNFEQLESKEVTLILHSRLFDDASSDIISEEESVLGRDFDLVDVLIERELLKGNAEKMDILEREGLDGLDNKSLLELFEDIQEIDI